MTRVKKRFGIYETELLQPEGKPTPLQVIVADVIRETNGVITFQSESLDHDMEAVAYFKLDAGMTVADVSVVEELKAEAAK